MQIEGLADAGECCDETRLYPSPATLEGAPFTSQEPAAGKENLTESDDDDAWFVVDAVANFAISEPSTEAPSSTDHSLLVNTCFSGQLNSWQITELTLAQVRSRYPSAFVTGEEDCSVFQLQTTVSNTLRTIRLAPHAVQCRRLDARQKRSTGRWGKPSGTTTWSFPFTVAIEHTENSFVNVGLVEWLADRSDGEPARTKHTSMSLAELLKLKTISEDEKPSDFVAEQQASESPLQMMLGCRKGVRWFGNGVKFPLLEDGLCDGSVLRFRCDYHIDKHGDIVQVQLWLMPSPVVFEFQGKKTIQDWDLWDEPLFHQWREPPQTTKESSRLPKSLWVPAVTLFSQGDTVAVAWSSPPDLDQTRTDER